MLGQPVPSRNQPDRPHQIGLAAKNQVQPWLNPYRRQDDLPEGILATIGHTPLIRLSRLFPFSHFSLYSKLEAFNPGGSIKDRAAYRILQSALETAVIQADTTILHISLRDLAPEVILACDNVVDDVDHVCRARTSLHLAELQVGHHDFICCTLADITRGTAPPRRKPEGITVFSPFGLGVLDLVISRMVVDEAYTQNLGITIEAFLPGLPLND